MIDCALMTLAIIVAMDKNRVIGKGNQLPWHLPADLKHFKSMTMGKPVIMGRKTYESLGKLLPGRRNIIISRQADVHIAGAETFPSLETAFAAVTSHETVMIIGGAEIFRAALPKVTRLYLTLIEHAFEGDTYFPPCSESEWKVVSREIHFPDEKNRYAFSFVELVRITASRWA